MEAARWDRVSRDFAPDGSLRDIYIENTTLADWERTIAHIQKRYGPVRFTIDGESAPIPANPGEIFDIRSDRSALLTFAVEGIEIAAHFFVASEIEFDLIPNQVNASVRFDALLEFLRGLAGLLQKPVILTAENAKNAVILRAVPDLQAVEYVPSAQT
jgi:hypothetical protein